MSEDVLFYLTYGYGLFSTTFNMNSKLELRTEPEDNPADVTHTSISHISLYLSQNYQITTLAYASFQLTYMFVSEFGHCLFRTLA
jgi:hypothetical protein